MIDVLIIEEGNGGDLFHQKSGVFGIVNGVENMPYLAMFGGSVDGNWWGNDLLFPEDIKKQIKSSTERTLQSVALNSNGRSQIEQAIRADLAFLENDYGAKLTIGVSLLSDDRLSILVSINGKQMKFLWHPETELKTI